MKKITFTLAFLAVFSFQGCDVLMDALEDALFEKDELEIRATGELIVSDYNTYSLDSGIYSVHVSFSGLTDADQSHYHPKVIIYDGNWKEIDSFSGAAEINGNHSELYSVYIFSSKEVIIYAELRWKSAPTHYDTTAFLKLTKISVG